MQPIVTQEAIEEDGEQAGCHACQGEVANQRPGLLPKPRRLGGNCSKRLADLADLTPPTGRPHDRQPIASHNERAGEEEGLVLATRPSHSGVLVVASRQLSHGSGFTCQKRLVDQQVVGSNENGISGYTVALKQDNGVTTDDLAARDALSRAITDDERPRTGHIPQRFEDAFAAKFLNDADRNGDKGEDQQHQCIG